MAFSVLCITQPTENDFAFHLAKAVEGKKDVTWKTIQDLAQSHSGRNPEGYILRGFGSLNLKSIEIKECKTSWNHISELVKEILTHYISPLIDGKDIILIRDSRVGRMKECQNYGARKTIIFFILQSYLKMLPMSLPQALAWQLHRIVPLSDPDNLKMIPFLNNREIKRVQHRAFIHAIFNVANLGSITLTRAQWCDIGITLVHDEILPEKSGRHLLEEWSEEILAAKTSVQMLLQMTVVRDLLLTGSYKYDHVNFQKLTFHRDCELTTQNAYPAWEDRQVLKYILSSILSTQQIDLAQFEAFVSTCQPLLQDHTTKSKCVFFVQELSREYDGYRQARDDTDYQRAAATLKSLSQTLAQLVKDQAGVIQESAKSLNRFMQIVLLITHQSLFFALDVAQFRRWFDVYSQIADLDDIFEAWDEPVVKLSNASSNPLNLQRQLLSRGVFTPEEQVGLLVACCHHNKRVRRAALESALEIRQEDQPLTLEETLAFLDVFERYINCHLPTQVTYNFLRWQFMTDGGRAVFENLKCWRKVIFSHIERPFMDELIPKIVEKETLFCNQKIFLPEAWSQERVDGAIQHMYLMRKILRFSTLLHSGEHEECVRLIPGLILNNSIIPHNELEEWCNLHRSMVRTLAPNNRALWVDGVWVRDNQAFQVLVKWILSQNNPQTFTVKVELGLTRAELAEDVFLMDLLPGLLKVLCDEYIPVGTLWTVQQESSFQIVHLEDLLHKYAQTNDDDQAAMQEMYQRFNSYLQGAERAVRTKRINSVIQFAIDFKKALRSHVIDICEMNDNVPVLSPADKAAHAAKGNLWPAMAGLSLVPSTIMTSLDAPFGIDFDTYKECFTLIAHRILSNDFSKFSLERICRIAVSLGQVNELSVDILCELKSQNYKGKQISYCQVVMSIHEDKRILFSSRYLDNLDEQQLLQMLYWHLGQLKSVCYAG